MNKFWDRANSTLLLAAPTVDFLIARFTYCWGLWLLLPLDTFGSSRGFIPMARIAPEEVWGIILFFWGSRLRYYIVKDNLRGKRDSMFGIFVLWAFIAAMLVIGNPQATGTVVYPLMAVHALIAYLIFNHRYKYLEKHNNATLTNGRGPTTGSVL